MSDVILWHNPACGTSRAALAMLRAAGIEPRILPYLQSPPDRETLRATIAAAGLTVREALRAKEPLCAELGLDDLGLGEAALLEAMLAHPVLINRPFVIAPGGTRLCRPAERLREILPGA
ncbi:arsenate reductase (glutaredoxin) [Roseicella frigidaeris]|uniref:Arsenate reductase n=1 Tax=Roseicella frigidaeris TaxID=2230885 RepID=A0A327M6C5_9PROT|nr:arsenate reductase (glutaredoxin) [Roseicella frigidaeris]RAI58480.1 arsenate reductase (glutaredoxin) [Roseicella frigidaeris]